MQIGCGLVRFGKIIATFFSEKGAGGGSEAVRKFSGNSSILEKTGFPKFGTKVELQRRVVSEHQVPDSMEMGEDVVAHLTTTRSQENIVIANRAEDWVSNPMAIDHMVRVMKGICKSKRHTLFLERRERLRCSGSDTSRLYQLSNPSFLGGGGEVDTAVIKQLEKVFLEHLAKAQKELQHVYATNSQMAFVYASCVLFPETFIHHHQLQGKNREEAEVAFMEVAVDAEEEKVTIMSYFDNFEFRLM